MQMGTWVELFMRAVLWEEPSGFPFSYAIYYSTFTSMQDSYLQAIDFHKWENIVQFYIFWWCFWSTSGEREEICEKWPQFQRADYRGRGSKFRWQFSISFLILLFSASSSFLYITSVLTNRKITCVNESQFLKTQCSYHNDVNETNSIGFFFLSIGKCQLEWEVLAPGNWGFKDNEQQGSLRRLFGYLGCVLTSWHIHRT